MKKHLSFLSIALAALAINGCSWSPPKTVYPDGTQRVPANSPEKIAELQTAREKSRAMVAENDELRADIAAMRQQINDVNLAVMGVLAASQEQKPPAPQQPAAQQVNAPAATPGAPQSDLNATLYRLTYPFGGIEFNPSEAEKATLTRLGKNAASIEINGYTDSPVADAPNKYTAYKRAHNAKMALIGLGIDGGIIRSHSIPANHFVAPNHDAAGRAQNRRVEILFLAKQ